MLFNEKSKGIIISLVFVMLVILTASSVLGSVSINTSIAISITVPAAGTECKYSAAGQTCGGLGAHCGFAGDSSHPADPTCCAGMNCFYAMCMAKIGTSCSASDACNGPCESSVIDCQGGKCCGRHAHPCTGGRDSPDCCEGFHCDQAGTEGIWPYYNFCEGDEGGELSCTEQGKVLCDDSVCNIGHAECNPLPPAKTYTVPEGQRCKFTGTVKNSGCAWNNPATLSISGSGCSQQIKFSDCETKSFEFTCNPGTVTLSSDDSAYFTLTYSCSQSAPCGNGIIEPGEVCEPPFTNNDGDCAQADYECLNHKLGARDGFGYCNSACSCFEDEFVYQCVAGQCGASCSVNADCNDNNPATPDFCLSSNCSCSHSPLPYCGNGNVEPGEECEYDSQCIGGGACVSCQCTNNLYCGNNMLNPSEQCDRGVFNGIPCVPPTNGQCTYCTTNCTYRAITGSSCGNGIVDYGEQCDSGSNNGVSCTPSCDDSCAYCGANCQVAYANGGSCSGGGDGDGYDEYPYYYPSGPIITPCSYYGASCNRPRASVCGDGITGLGEECDKGRNNGVVCIPECGQSCTYCTRSCKAITLQGGACVYTSRPWDVNLPLCREVFIPINYSHLDYGCGADNDDVTKEAHMSDNLRAEQKACNLAPSYIDLHWYGLGQLKGFKNISLALEHKEQYANIKIEYSNGSSWNKLCDLYSSTFDSIDDCLIPMIYDCNNLSLRVRISRTGSMESVEFLDFAALKLVYCTDSAYACGNGRVELNEECDDGNINDGDDCSSICTSERWSCGSWSACTDSKQSQLCTYGSNFKTNTRSCKPALTWWWIFFLIIIIFLLLILLFLPYLLLAFSGKKKKDKK